MCRLSSAFGVIFSLLKESGFQTKPSEKHPAGSKIHYFFVGSAAQRKSCPFNAMSFSATCKTPLDEARNPLLVSPAGSCSLVSTRLA